MHLAAQPHARPTQRLWRTEPVGGPTARPTSLLWSAAQIGYEIELGVSDLASRNGVNKTYCRKRQEIVGEPNLQCCDERCGWQAHLYDMPDHVRLMGLYD